MLQTLLNKTKNIIITLRFSLLSIFIVLFLIMMLTMLSIFYFHLSEVVLHAALLLMDRTSYSVLYQLDDELSPAQTASQFSANNIREQVLDHDNLIEMSSYLMHLIGRISLVRAAYWGDYTGDFIFVEKEADGYIAEYINRKVDPPTDVRITFDKNHKIVRQENLVPHYDPRVRPWYLTALEKKHTTWTDLYPYFEYLLGISVATPVFFSDGRPIGVFGMDVRLDTLADFIAKQKVGKRGEVFIIDKNGTVVASPLGRKGIEVSDANVKLKRVHEIDRPWLAEAFNIYKKSGHSVFQFRYEGKGFLATFKPIPVLKENGWTIAIVSPQADFTRDVHTIELVYMVNFALIFLAGLALMSHLVTRVVTPIRQLVRETEKIKYFQLEGHKKISSRIKEVIELSDAIYSMKRGLRSFEKYVPAGLVRQLIKTGEDAVISGTKKELAVFFSDIQDFTAITERSDSNLLIKQICYYFEIFSHVIIQHHGTIDKYIGDSVMAFWGAPLPVKHPSIQAASAALLCLQYVTEMNKKWSSEDMALFNTHIGIHYGEAIVGSLGSSERLNYTALGDTVNIASRLVGVNKLYGTHIIVSSTVYDMIKHDFVLRLIDTVVLKGKAESIQIYELLTDDASTLNFDIDQYRDTFAQAFAAYQHQDWEKAIGLFNECLVIYPEDTVAFVFIERCVWLNLNAPPQDWDGIWHISEK